MGPKPRLVGGCNHKNFIAVDGWIRWTKTTRIINTLGPY